MNVFITSVGSYLGSILSPTLIARGANVTGSTRRELAVQTAGIERIELGKPFDPALFEGVDAVIHCAHDFSPGALQLNLDGTRAIFEAARERGARRQIFISSYSARPEAASEYGRIKYQLECFFLERDQIVIRPGLVIGGWGLFGRTMRTILSTPVTPLVDGGRDPVAFIGADDFRIAAATIVESAPPGAYNLFHRDLVTLRTLVETLNRLAGHRSVYPSVSVPVALFALSAARAIGLRLPVDAGNLKGLKLNRDCPFRSDLETFIPHPRSLEGALTVALDAVRGKR